MTEPAIVDDGSKLLWAVVHCERQKLANPSGSDLRDIGSTLEAVLNEWLAMVNPDTNLTLFVRIDVIVNGHKMFSDAD